MGTSKADSVSLKNGKTKNPVKLDYKTLRKAVMTLRAVNHDLRQKIIKMLDKGKRATVTQIYVKLRLEQSVPSQHLAILRRAGVVNTEREGKYIYYSLNQARIKEIANLIEQLAN